MHGAGGAGGGAGGGGYNGKKDPLEVRKNHEILTALQYKPLYNISRSEKWGKKHTSHGL